VTDPAPPRPVPGPPRAVPAPPRAVPGPPAPVSDATAASPAVPAGSPFAGLADRPVAEHVGVYEAEHERLQRELSTIDQL
jgi:hypothetical protein